MYPCPIPMFNVSPTNQDSPIAPSFHLLSGSIPSTSAYKSTPVFKPKPNCFKKAAIRSTVN